MAALGFGLLGSAISVPSCHWLRLRGREELNRNVGIWRRSPRGDASASCWFYCCAPYPYDFEPDRQLKLARAASIMAPSFGGISLFALLNQDPVFKPSKWKIAVLCSALAAIFQGLTLIVRQTQMCDISTNSYCHVGVSTWAFWVSVAAVVCYIFATCIAAGPMSAGPSPDENEG